MLKSKLLSVAVACALLGVISAAQAAPVIDQSQLSFDIGVPFSFGPTSPNYPIGQSFTAGLSGQLSDIDIFSNGGILGGSNTVTLDVHSGNGVGNGTLLGTENASVASVYDSGLGLYFLSIDVTGLGINVNSGSQYTFDITNVTGSGDLATRGVLGSEQNPYAGGQIYTGPGYGSPAAWDLAFQTTVGTVPEPKTYLLALAGLALMGLIRRKKQA